VLSVRIKRALFYLLPSSGNKRSASLSVIGITSSLPPDKYIIAPATRAVDGELKKRGIYLSDLDSVFFRFEHFQY